MAVGGQQPGTAWLPVLHMLEASSGYGQSAVAAVRVDMRRSMLLHKALLVRASGGVRRRTSRAGAAGTGSSHGRRGMRMPVAVI